MISVVVPAYNEAAIIKKNIGIICDYMESLESKYCWELIIVNDGSSDWSQEVAEQLSETYSQVSCIHHPANLGVGRALLSGYAWAKNENVVAIPADGQFNTDEPGTPSPFGNGCPNRTQSRPMPVGKFSCSGRTRPSPELTHSWFGMPSLPT